MVRKRNRQAPDADAGPDTQRASREDGTDSVERTRQHNGTSTNVHTEALASKPKQPPKSQPTSDMGHDRAPKAKSARAPEHAQIAADSRKPVEQQQKRPRRGLQYALTAGLLIAAVLLLPRVLEDTDGVTWSKWSVAAPMPHPLPPVNLSLSLPTSVNVTALLGPSLAAPLDSLLAAAAAISINLTSSLASSGLGSHGEPLLYGNASQPPTSPSALLPALDLLASSLSETITGSAAQAQVQIRTLLSQLPAFQGLGGGGGASEHGQGQGREAGSEAAALRAGQQMARRGYKAKHPVVIVPGFVTSGLELWQGLPCGRKYFRQRMWGTLAMLQAFLLDAQCWFSHLELDPDTGLDPEGIKIRAATGLEAIDYFIQGYWVWGKMVEALADVGYDSNTLVSMPYDWRLAMPLLEVRDGFFTRMRATVETLVATTGHRAVLTAHSYGENVARAFLTWADASSPGWVEAHVEAMVNIAGTSLGVPKAVSALLSGETYDTAQLGGLSSFLTSNLVPRGSRTRLWRSWGASYAMLPVGGSAVWGNASWAPDDTPDMRAAGRTYGAMVSVWPHNWQAVLEAAEAASGHAAGPDVVREAVAAVSQGGGGSGLEAAAGEGPSGQQQQQQQASSCTSGGSCGGEAEAGYCPNTHSGGKEGEAAAQGTCSSSSSSLLPSPPPEEGSCSAGADPDTNATTASNSSNSNSTGGAASSSPAAAAPSSSSSLPGPIGALTDRLRKLVAGAPDPADHLGNDKVSRLDVHAFLALLQEAGGPAVQHHMAHWAATPLKLEGQEGEGQEGQHKGQEGAASSNEGSVRGTTGTQARTRPASRRAALLPDATKTPLPNAPTTRYVCLYGVGLPTERAYHYVRPPPPPPTTPTAGNATNATNATAGSGEQQKEDGETLDAAGALGEGGADAGAGGCGADEGVGESGSCGGEKRDAASQDSHLPPPHGGGRGSSGQESSTASSDATAGWAIMRDITHPEASLDVGVQLGDGDGTVPLLSLGLMCRKGWAPGGRLNPAGSPVVTREYKHRTVSMLQDPRGGPAAAAHIDILGNDGLLMDVIRVAAGRGHELADELHSDIDRIAASVDFGSA